jgi:RimJ/RimL family protein N-acetyltransferase
MFDVGCWLLDVSFEMRVILETPRLRLRELNLGDIEFVAGLLAHPEVMHFWPKTYTRDEAEVWIRRQTERYARDGYGYWLALDESGQPIGQAGLLAQQVDVVPETGIGYIIHRPCWRQGYATEAAAHCRDLRLRAAQQWPPAELSKG